MRNANECRAKDPRACYYHGAIIEMNEAMERITNAGAGARPADWDGYFNARQKVETAEEDLKKQQWLGEAQELVPQKFNAERFSKRGAGTANKGGNSRIAKGHESSSRGSERVQKEGLRGRNYSAHRTSQNSTPRSKPVVAANVNYDDNVFPQQIKWKDEKGQPAFFTRHDKTSQLPKGLMLASNRELNMAEKEQLVNFVKYQHTISTRDGKELKHISEDDVSFDHTSRSVYVRTQFADAEQVQGFHAALSNLISQGSSPRQNGTQKYERFSDNKAGFALYYNN